jgi:hypothetical protein
LKQKQQSNDPANANGFHSSSKRHNQKTDQSAGILSHAGHPNPLDIIDFILHPSRTQIFSGLRRASEVTPIYNMGVIKVRLTRRPIRVRFRRPFIP